PLRRQEQGRTPPRQGRRNTMLGRAVPPGWARNVSPPGEGAEWVPESVANRSVGSFARAASLVCGEKRLARCSLRCKRAVMSPVGSPHVCGRRRRPPTSYYGGRRPNLAPGSGVFGRFLCDSVGIQGGGNHLAAILGLLPEHCGAGSPRAST